MMIKKKSGQNLKLLEREIMNSALNKQTWGSNIYENTSNESQVNYNSSQSLSL